MDDRPELFALYESALGATAQGAVSLVVGQVIAGMRRMGATPAQIGACFMALAEYQAEVETSPEAVRFAQAQDQIVARSMDVLPRPEDPNGS